MTVPLDYQKFHLTVRDQENRIVESGISYTVYTAGTTTEATIYTDLRSETEKTNPVTTTVFAVDRGVKFYALTATVDIVLEINSQKTFVEAVGPGTEHLVVISPQETDSVMRVGRVFEFDAGVAVAVTNVIIPAADNPRGLLITHIWAQLTEVMAGTEDQGIMVVSDESNNALATITPTDGGADAIGDYLAGYQSQSATLGDAAFLVAANEFVDAAYSQLTTGSNAGKMKVYVEYIRL